MKTVIARPLRSHLSRATALAFLAGSLSYGSIAQAQALLYKFTESGTTCLNSGTLHSEGDLKIYDADGNPADLHSKAGPNGKPCLDFTSATGMGTGFSGPCLKGQSGDVFDGATSFTVAGWYKSPESPNGSARIFQSGARFILSFVNNSLCLQVGQDEFIDTITSLDGRIEGGDAGKASAASKPLSFDTVDQWVFFAVTYDRSSTGVTVTFYKGEIDPAKPLLAYSVTYRPSAKSLGNAAEITWGGNGVPNIRPFQGMLANISVYTSGTKESAALNAAAIKKLQTSSLAK